MPTMPGHRCPTCGSLVTGRCSVCRDQRDRRRGTATSRGYTSERWRRFRALQLELEPLCRICSAHGRTTRATCVDHVTPVSGPDDARFLDFAAVQSLCHRCHSIKTATEDSTFAKAVTPGEASRA